MLDSNCCDSGEQVRIAYDGFAEIYEDYVGYKAGYDEEFVRSLDKEFKSYGEQVGSSIRTVLDCACGPGNPGLGLATLGYEVCCCDISPKMIQMTKQNDTNGLLKDVRVASWYDLHREYCGQRFDAVVCASNAVFHIPSDEAFSCALASMHGVLKDGGVCYIDYLNVKNDYSYHGGNRVDAFGEFVHSRTGQAYITFRTYHFDRAQRWMTFIYYFGRDDGTGNIKSWLRVPVAGRPILTEEIRKLAIAAGFSTVKTKCVRRDGKFAEFNAILAIR